MDFVHITDYNHLSVLTFIGNATSRASESVLVDIGRYVHRIDIRMVDTSSLVDIEQVQIQTELPQEERIADYIRQIKNPYC